MRQRQWKRNDNRKYNRTATTIAAKAAKKPKFNSRASARVLQLMRGLPRFDENEAVTMRKSMTYEVLTRRPVPVFAFLPGRPAVVGVPARETDRDPGARSGWNESSVGEL